MVVTYLFLAMLSMLLIIGINKNWTRMILAWLIIWGTFIVLSIIGQALNFDYRIALFLPVIWLMYFLILILYRKMRLERAQFQLEQQTVANCEQANAPPPDYMEKTDSKSPTYIV